MNFKYRNLFDFSIILILFILFFYWISFPAPKDFPVNGFVQIEDGLSVLQAGEALKKGNVIRSCTIFVLLSKIMGIEKKIKSGEYFFEKPISVVEVIKRLGDGNYGLRQKKITITEGAALKDIVNIFKDFNNFKEEEFYLITKDPSLEGYLFPDTYFVLPSIDATGVVKIMKINFEEKINSLKEEIEKNNHNLNEIITMASLIEKEVSNFDDKKIVSGILWKRIGKGMPLQVDAIFVYLLGKTSAELTLDDLKIDSQYNTYTNKGLPPTPICNPGLESIEATLRPIDSSYFYYLSDKEGNIHFAKNFEEHKINKNKYLR